MHAIIDQAPIVSALNPLSSVARERFAVGCEGELIHAYPTAAEALRFARWSADVTGCPHEILDAARHTALLIVEPEHPAL